jgi:hypothetical protein
MNVFLLKVCREITFHNLKAKRKYLKEYTFHKILILQRKLRIMELDLFLFLRQGLRLFLSVPSSRIIAHVYESCVTLGHISKINIFYVHGVNKYE